jgi:phage terminase small subunit
MGKAAIKVAKFVQEYLVDLNGTQAAIRAGYAPKSAYVTASKLLKKPEVKASLGAAMAERSKRTEVTADRVIQEIARLAFVDVSKAYDANTGELLRPHEMPENVRAAFSGLDFSKSGDRVGKFVGKERALEMLAKHLGLLRDKVELSGKDGEALSIRIDLGAGK